MRRGQLLLVLAVGVFLGTAGADEPKPKPLTAEQQERLKERDRLAGEVNALWGQGKQAEAIAAWQKKLVLERAVFGDVDAVVAGSLATLARLYELREDFAAARPARREVLAICTKLYGEKDWRVTDARLELRDLDLRAGLDATGRQGLRQAEALGRQAERLWQQGRPGEALPSARQALAIRRERLGEDHPHYALSLNNLAALYRDMGDYGKALPLFEQARDIRQKALGEDHPDYASTLNNLALLYQDMGDYGQALPLYEQARDITRKALGEAHPDYARSLNNMALLHQAMGDYGKALPLFEQARDIHKKALGEEHPAYATSLDNLALLYQARGDNGKALPLLEQARDITRKALGEAHPAYATNLNNLAWLYQAMGDYGKALPLFEQARDLLKKVLGEEHPHYARSLHNLARLYRAMGDYGKALPLFEQARDLLKKVLGEEHPHYALSLSNLAALYRDMGDYGKALPLLEQARDITRKGLGEAHPDYASNLNTLADLYRDRGDYVKALLLYEQARDLLKKVLGKDHPTYGRSLNSLAALYQDMGDYGKALPLLEQARDITRKALGEAHPDYASTLNNLALLYQDMGDYGKALPLYEQARDIRQKALSEAHPAYARSLHNLAGLYGARGDYGQALPLYEQARDITRKALGEAHPDYADTLNNLAALYQGMGDYGKALPLSEQARDIRQKALGEEHPLYAQNLSYLAILHLHADRPALARPLLEQALDITNRVADATFAVQSDRQRADFWALGQAPLAGYLAAATPAAPEVAPSPYARVLAGKDSLVARRAEEHLAAHAPELALLLHELRRARAGLACLLADTPRTPEQRADWAHRFDKLEADKEAAERRLAEKSAAYRRFRDLRRAGPDRVADALPPYTALLDFVTYYHLVPAPRGKPPYRWEERLLAFVVVKGRDPVCVPLGPAAPVAEAVAAWRSAVVKQQPADEAGAALARLVWRPLTKYLGDARTVLVAPDGPLCGLPFAALPGSKPGSYLLEEVALGYLSSGRHLLELAADSDRPASAGLLALGGLDYGPRRGGLKVAAADTGQRGVAWERGANPYLFLGTSYWKPLPGTALEAQRVARAYRDAFPKEAEPRLLSGPDGDAARLQRELTSADKAPRWRYLHLATHGYFQPPDPAAVKRPPADPFDLGAFTRRTWVRNPYLLSGLVLSGANRSPEGGTLSAEQLKDLDLRGCELAVLSACDTGLGKVADGAGVQGLQQVFQIAGARTVVASLWKVNDAATSVLMEEFYANLWQRKLSKLEALRQAQLVVLKDPERVRRRAKELEEERAKAGLRAPEEDAVPLPEAGPDVKRSHPALWAAFVPYGDTGGDQPRGR